MRLITKFHALCALGLCGILLSTWLLASGHYYRRVVSPNLTWESDSQSQSQSPPSYDRRLVVFGDSWSDNAAAIAGSVWTNQLCSEVRLYTSCR